MAVSRRMWLREQERKRRERERRARRRRNIALIAFLAAAIVVAVIVIRGFGESKSSTVDDPDETAQLSGEPASYAPLTAAPSAAAPAVEVNADYFDNAVFIGNAVAVGIDQYGLLPYTDFYAGVTITLENVYTTAANNDSMAVIDQLKSKKFNKVYLSFGETELSWNDPERFAEQYEELLDRVKSYQQSSGIYIISIPPVAETASVAGAGYSLSNIRAYNKALKTIAAAKKVYYIDSFAALGGNYLPAGISADGINLNREYYAILLDYAQKHASIPSLSDISDEDEDEDEEDPDNMETDESDDGEGNANVDAVSDDNEEEPLPTVNVLKSSGNIG